MTAEAEVRTEVEWLEHDVVLLRTMVREQASILRPLADHRDPARHNYFETIASLYWACVDYADGACQLIGTNNRAALVPVQRSLLEAATNLRCLASAEDPVGEAAVRKAYALLKQLKWPESPEANREARAILAKMPEAVVELARSRESKRRGWTGKSWKALLDMAGFSSYDAYGLMAELSHSSALYGNVAWEESGEQRQLRLGYRLSQTEADLAANFTRRMLFTVHDVFWKAFDGPLLTVSTTDPFEWLKAQTAALQETQPRNGV